MSDLFTQLGTQETHYDLPDADITLFENFFTPEDSDRLFASLKENVQWQQDQIKFYGKEIDLPRLTAWYGDPGATYTYSGIQMHPHPWSEDLLFIKQRIEEVAKVTFTSALINLYRDGKDCVHWHQDNEKELGENPVIGSVSFGETRPFQLKHLKKDLPKTDIPLAHGSFLLMKGATQHHWKHKIPKTAKIIGQRINLTFRVIQQIK